MKRYVWTLRVVPALMLLVIVSMLLSACPSGNVSSDPEIAKVQRLEDFCLSYKALRNGFTVAVEFDAQRVVPLLTEQMVDAGSAARNFIRPYCEEGFDPVSEPFDLLALNAALRKLRDVMLSLEKQT